MLRSSCSTFGAIAQLGERLLCKQEVVGSIPSGSTSRDFDKLVRRNEIRVRSHYGLARAKGSRELRRRVLSDIVKRRFVRMPRERHDPQFRRLNRLRSGKASMKRNWSFYCPFRPEGGVGMDNESDQVK